MGSRRTAGPEGPAYVVLILSIAVLQLNAQGSLSLKDVLQRVEDYVESYGARASIVVCSERYTQEARASAAAGNTRQLVSDFAIVRADAIHGWLGFRDVLEVDGRVVADREDRLARVLMASEGRYDEAKQISDESARYNIGSIQRNFNVPTTTLFFFGADNRARFKFSARTVAADGTWEIAFSERDKPSLIRTPEGRSILSSGTIYVQPQDGTVVRTTLRIDSREAPRGKGSVDVRYARVEALNMWLPVSMDETFEGSPRNGGWTRVTGHAEYSNYRTFTTSGRIK
jgi:hypothetical protein